MALLNDLTGPPRLGKAALSPWKLRDEGRGPKPRTAGRPFSYAVSRNTTALPACGHQPSETDLRLLTSRSEENTLVLHEVAGIHYTELQQL